MRTTRRAGVWVALGLLLGSIVVGGAVMPTVSASAETLDQQDIRNATNSYRHLSGMSMLSNNESLNDVAQAWAETMAASRSLWHNPSVGTQIPRGYVFWGENIASGYPTPLDMVDAWWYSPSHRANILLEGATDIGSGYALDRNGVAYAVEIIAAYRTATPTPTPGPSAEPDPGPEVPGAPGRPGSVSATSIGPTAARVSWVAPETPPGSPVDLYWVVVSHTGNDDISLATTDTTLDIEGLVSPGVYTVTVRARYATGGWGSGSESASLTVTGQPEEGPHPTDPPTGWSPDVSRIAGSDRYEASANISLAGHPDTAPTVYVATGANFPDALSAAAVAGDQDAPLLLTMRDHLPAQTIAELERLRPERIVVLGGDQSVGDRVFAQLNAIAPASRIGGADRYDASLNFIAESFRGRTSVVVYVATGANFPDALSAAASAASVSAPVLLVPGTAPSLPTETRAAVRKLGATHLIVVGGPNSISPLIETELRSIAGVQEVTRVGGADRFEASDNINRQTFTAPVHTAYLATGLNFPDALSGAALAGSTSSPLFVVKPNCVPEAVLTTMRQLEVEEVVLLGGENSLSPLVASLLPCP